ncbi:MAG: hypothetical protein KI792_13625 [Alphaproteobacteria bacterium]|nr:hypothetical protein [Alphaproteobacteria bacterium SS10]
MFKLSLSLSAIATLAILALTPFAPAMAQGNPDNLLPQRDYQMPVEALSLEEMLAHAPPGQDRQALDTALAWIQALIDGDRQQLRNLASDTIFIDQRGYTIEEVLAQMDKAPEFPYRPLAFVITPMVDPVTGERYESRGTEGLNLGPFDRSVGLLFGTPTGDGLYQAQEGVELYIRYVPEGIYRVAGMWD